MHLGEMWESIFSGFHTVCKNWKDRLKWFITIEFAERYGIDF